MKIFLRAASLITLVLLFNAFALAYNKDDAVSVYSAELVAMGMDSEDAGNKAESDVDAIIAGMESDQYDVQVALDNLSTQVNALVKTSSRREAALEALDAADGPVGDFKDMEADEHLNVQPSLAGAPPLVEADGSFRSAQDAANVAISAVRRIMIAPDRPGAVPAGDIVTDFLPQIIRQLFRFAWLAILISLTVSGVMMVMAQGEDERVTKAKGLLYYSLIGFAFITLAFAMVKALTNIDFFRFI